MHQISLPARALHHAVRRDLAAFESAVRHTPVGDTDAWRALRGRWGLLAAVLGPIDPALAGCAEGFAAMAAHPCADHRNALDVHVTSTRALLLDHLRHEGSEALPLAHRRMTPFLLDWVLHGLTAEQLADLTPLLSPAQMLLARLGRRRFARRELRAFRYS